jgi:hypothetical protein
MACCRYQLALDEMKKHFDHDPVYNSWKAKEKGADSNAVMGLLTKLAATCSRCKADAAAEIAFKVLESKDAVVIFTMFVKTAGAIQEKLREMGESERSCVLASGEVR